MFRQLEKELKQSGIGQPTDLFWGMGQERKTLDSTPNNIIDWVQKVRIIKGKQFSFEDREYLKEIYCDQNKEIYVVKPRQMEITEFALNWLLYHLTKNPATVGALSLRPPRPCLCLFKAQT